VLSSHAVTDNPRETENYSRQPCEKEFVSYEIACNVCKLVISFGK